MKEYGSKCARCDNFFTSIKPDKEFCAYCVSRNATDRWRKRNAERLKEERRVERVGADVPCMWCGKKVYCEIMVSENVGGHYKSKGTGNIYCSGRCHKDYIREKRRQYKKTNRINKA